MVSYGATVAPTAGAASTQERKSSTIVARGQVDGVRCVDMLIDTGASCCFVRRSCAERLKLQQTPLSERVIVTLADKRTVVSTHEVRVNSMRVHGSAAACSLLVMDELSNDVIVGLNWQRAAGLTITPSDPYDLLNGQPVRYESAQRGGRTHQQVTSNSPASCQQVTSKLPVSSQPPTSEWAEGEPIQLSAAVWYATAAVPTESGSDASQRLASLSVADVDNSQLRQVLERHRRVFTEVLPVKTAEQIAQSNKFSIVLIGEAVRPREAA